MRSYLTITALLIATASPAVCQEKSTTIDEIVAAETKWINAIRTADSAALDQLLSNDLVYPHSVGTVVSKHDFIRELKRDVQNIEYSDRKIQVFGTTAVLTAQARITGASRGETYDTRVRITHVWAKTGGNWHLVAHQSTFMR